MYVTIPQTHGVSGTDHRLPSSSALRQVLTLRIHLGAVDLQGLDLLHGGRFRRIDLRTGRLD